MTKPRDPVDAEPMVISLSAINHYVYCPRRCGLIYQEGEFEDNIHTSRGNAEHDRVDKSGHVTIGEGARVEFALPVWSDRFGLIGKCDVVEFWSDGTIYPVEYKHGVRKKWINDDLQLAAQALCLEEMFGRLVRKGSIYHTSSRRRRELSITVELLRRVVGISIDIRDMLVGERLADPVNDTRCKECSLLKICQPSALSGRLRQENQMKKLFVIEDE